MVSRWGFVFQQRIVAFQTEAEIALEFWYIGHWRFDYKFLIMGIVFRPGLLHSSSKYHWIALKNTQLNECMQITIRGR